MKNITKRTTKPEKKNKKTKTTTLAYVSTYNKINPELFTEIIIKILKNLKTMPKSKK